MAVKYVKDFEFPAAAGFHSSNMPSKAGMSSKGMPSRAKPNAPARGAARMESRPTMGKGQGYADGGKVAIQGRNQAEIKAAMAKAKAQRKAFQATRREEMAKRNAEIAARNAAKKAAKPSPKSVSKDFVPPTVQNIEMSSPRSVSKDFVPQTVQQIEMPSAKKPSYGKYGLQEYAKGGRVQKFARGGSPAPGSKAALTRMPGSKDYVQVPNPLSQLGIGSKVINVPKGHSDQSQRLSAVNKSSRTNAFTGAQNPEYDPAYDPAYEEQFGKIEEMRQNREPMKKARGGKVAKVMREYKKGELHSGSKKGPLVKNPKQAIAIALSEERKSGAKGVKKLSRGGPTSREATGPTSGRATYIPNPFGKSIKVYTGPTGGGQPRVSTRNPRDIFSNINPEFNEAMREAEETRKIEEMRKNREPLQRAMGGAVDNYAGKTGPYRGSPKKAKMLGRQDRRAREAMERAEKHAPGRSIDMPDRKAHGGMMRRKMA